MFDGCTTFDPPTEIALGISSPIFLNTSPPQSCVTFYPPLRRFTPYKTFQPYKIRIFLNVIVGDVLQDKLSYELMKCRIMMDEIS